MSLLPEDNLLANVRHVDVALVIMRGCAAPSEGQINERGLSGGGQLANANSQLEIPVLQRPRWVDGGGGVEG